jgi:DNA uptake protein ComE-like DNA-binding protein
LGNIVRTVQTVKGIVAAVIITVISVSAQAGVRTEPVVNVNTATVAQLQYLPGVGPKTAELIVAGRTYAQVADLDRVKGIGPAKLRALAPYARVSGPTTATAKIKAARTVKP